MYESVQYAMSCPVIQYAFVLQCYNCCKIWGRFNLRVSLKHKLTRAQLLPARPAAAAALCCQRRC